MKGVLNWLAVLLSVLAIAISMAVHNQLGSDASAQVNVDYKVDSLANAVTTLFENSNQEPRFQTVEDMYSYHEWQCDIHERHATFVQIPPDLLIEIANVILKRQEYVDEQSIVEEYRANQSIYDNLTLSWKSNEPKEAPREPDLDTIEFQKFETPDSVCTL